MPEPTEAEAAAVEIMQSLPDEIQEQLDNELARFPLERVKELGFHSI